MQASLDHLPSLQVPSLSRPGLADMGRAPPVAAAGPLPALPARKQDTAPGARRSASMGSQALQSAIGQKLSLLYGSLDQKHGDDKVRVNRVCMCGAGNSR